VEVLTFPKRLNRNHHPVALMFGLKYSKMNEMYSDVPLYWQLYSHVDICALIWTAMFTCWQVCRVKNYALM